jgi:Secretion system C-terminal sorting domain
MLKNSLRPATYSALLILLCAAFNLPAQSNGDCNKLGAWLWYIEITGFQTHAQIADKLSSLGIKRIYVKVADGVHNPAIWPELTNTALVNAYKSRGLEVWAWSYNYPNNPTGQANALYKAAETGYQGYVVDVEMEFDGMTSQVSNLFSAFAAKKTQAIADNKADSTFKLYCTTWGNPVLHNFSINLIDPHVDGFMPQTYVEAWGPSYVNNLEYWIQVTNDEYAQLGATKPIHHINALEDGAMTAAQIDQYIAKAGPETSLWRIPGGGVSTSLWSTWEQIDWEKNFCPPSSTSTLVQGICTLSPNPASDRAYLQTDGLKGRLELFDLSGKLLSSEVVDAGTAQHRIDLSRLPSGIFMVKWSTAQGMNFGKLVKA